MHKRTFWYIYTSPAKFIIYRFQTRVIDVHPCYDYRRVASRSIP